jgi:SSS family solute:Na+ symporter
MADRTLAVWNVASLLVSTSCGISFLLGTGELALQQGMAACLYAVATAIGLVALALSAPRLQKTGQSIWTYFGSLYGPTISRQVAAFSLIWMTGVLSAQIRGASAILALSGMPQGASIISVDCLVLVFSFLRISWLSGMFALCMCGCNAILVYTLVETHSLILWLRSPAIFMESIRAQPVAHTGLVLLSVAALVLCGADYQQFPAMAKTPTHARYGCLVAAIIVLGVGFLPASAVIAGANLWQLDHLADPAQVVPKLLARVTGSSGQVLSLNVTCLLIITALGSACSILRAMTDATATVSRGSPIPVVFHRILPVLVATVVAIYGHSIVNVMVTLNIVYLSAVVPLLILTLLGYQTQDRSAKRSMFVGAGVSALCVLIGWTRTIPIPEAIPLILAWPCALITALRSRPPVLQRPNLAASVRKNSTNAHGADRSMDSPSSLHDVV